MWSRQPPSVAFLVDAAKAGSSLAFEHLYRAMAGQVSSYLRWHRASDPDGLTNDVFLQVYRNLSGFQGDEKNFRSWVFTIAHHRMIDDRRRTSRQPRFETDPAPEEHLSTGDVEEGEGKAPLEAGDLGLRQLDVDLHDAAAVGAYPVRSVEVLDRIIRHAESAPPLWELRGHTDGTGHLGPLCDAAVTLAELEVGCCFQEKGREAAQAEIREVLHANKLDIRPFTRHTAAEYGMLKAALMRKFASKGVKSTAKWPEVWTSPVPGQPLGADEFDLVLVSHAIERNMVLVTSDPMGRIIEGITSLGAIPRFDDWTSGGGSGTTPS